MRTARITAGGQLSIPAVVRRRWGTSRVAIEDLGDRLVVKPVPDDPIGAARGKLAGRIGSTGRLRSAARRDEQASARG
jgi:bifunctional DNA-binding transcriptional regulator/antitoxin component of YhaV-PrlF toxin-antitoxin module